MVTKAKLRLCCPLLLQFAKALAKFVADEKMSNLRVWTSLMKRTIQTTSGIDAPKEHWKALNEIDAVSTLVSKKSKF